MNPIKQLEILRRNVQTWNIPKFYKEGFTAIGWGDYFVEEYSIPTENLYCISSGKMSNYKAGNLFHVMYYVTNQFYKTYIMDTQLKNNMSEQVLLAEQFIGKSVKGTIHVKSFIPDSIRICTKHSNDTFLTTKDKSRVEEIGWVLILESVNDYVNILDAKEVKSFKLNNEYTATIDGDEVRIGCQTFTKELILQFAQFLKDQ